MWLPLRHVAPLIDDAPESAPSAGDITVVPPKVAVLWKAAVVHGWVVGWPAAAVHDWAAGLVEEVGHAWIAVVHVEEFAVAAVHLEHVNFPASEGLGVLVKVTLGAGVATAGQSAVVVVDTELNTLLVGVVSEPADAVWEALLVWIDLAVLVTAWAHPAVVNVNILVAILEPAIVGHVVDHIDDELFGNAGVRMLLAVSLAAELLPLHPSHRRSERKAVVQRQSKASKQK